MPTSNRPDEPGFKHPIQVAARRSGLTTDVIRAWERRYGAVSPDRSSNNRRLYSDEQIEKLLILNRVIRSGRRIGEVARLSLDELRSIADSDDSASARVLELPAPTMHPAEQHLSECVAAVEKLDAGALELALGRASTALSVPALMDHVLVPFMRIIGERWQVGSLRIAHEHLATAVVRSFLTEVTNGVSLNDFAPELIVATPVGQTHELGALVVGIVAAAEGWRVTYAGPGLPAREIAALVHERRATVVALSIVYPADDPRLDGELKTLRECLGDDTAVIAGGASAWGYSDTLTEIGARILSDVGTFRVELQAHRPR